ncbi:MAG: alpha/beta fold hydrolase [Gemmatimonadota bacterium]
MVIARTAFELTNREGEGAGEGGGEGLPIRGDVWSAGGAMSDAAIVVVHGFKGFKDWGYFPFVSEQLAERTGHPVISFNFSGSGIGADLQNFTELDLFEANTFSKELDDLELVLDAAAAGELPALGSPGRFGLVGHSRGGGTAILKAGEDDRVLSLVTWAATADFNRWSDEMRAEWRRVGRLEVLNARTKQIMPLGVGLLEDAEKNAGRLDILETARAVRIPFLIIHGTEDESVPVAEGERLAAAAPADNARFAPIEGAGHTFGAVHPFKGSTPHLDAVLDLTAEWFATSLAIGV